MLSIDWANFTPGTALLGGIMIGVAAAALLLVNGRILGISGIVGGLIEPRPHDVGWRLAFIAGLLVPPLVLWFIREMEAPDFAGPLWLTAVAGLLVGFGSRMGSGCTSGHGICGMARLSKRSAAATLCFMLTGFVTVLLTRHLL